MGDLPDYTANRNISSESKEVVYNEIKAPALTDLTIDTDEMAIVKQDRKLNILNSLTVKGNMYTFGEQMIVKE